VRATSDFHLWSRKGDRVTEGSDLPSVFEDWKPNRERWLFIGPHDDDVVLGAGLLVQKAIEEGVHVDVLITTDGRMGYCSFDDRDIISAIRAGQARDSCTILGVRNVHWLHFPDCNLTAFVGRRRAERPGEPHVIAGCTGLQNAYTHSFRKMAPTRIFVPTGADLHPDHKIVHQECLISIFHACGEIWPELGAPLAAVPRVYETAIYCRFPKPPTIKLRGAAAHFETKLRAIAAYESQRQIAKLVENVRRSGPVEYFRHADLDLFSADEYAALF
jgi:LmbE family N-acetylglucosaminyl deacetylase